MRLHAAACRKPLVAHQGEAAALGAVVGLGESDDVAEAVFAGDGVTVRGSGRGGRVLAQSVKWVSRAG